MGEIVKFVAGLFLIAFLLVFTIPLLWLVWKLFVWLFGGLLFFTGSIWFIIFIMAIIAIVIMTLN